MSVIVAMPPKVIEFTQAQLRERWNKNYMPGISLRTVRRHIVFFRLRPHRCVGNQPFYLEGDVRAMEVRRHEFYLNRFDDRDGGAGIITVAKAKELVKRRRK
jgi:hypothetical protein